MGLIPVSEIKEMIRETSRSRLQAFINAQNVSIETVNQSELVYRPWLVVIMVAGNLLRVSIKVHFSMSHVKNLSCDLYDLTPETMNEEQALDFVREFCNLIAGAVKTDLANTGTLTEVSLPVGTRGWEEFFFALEEEGNDSDAWCLITDRGRLEVSTAIERFTATW